MMLHQLIP